MLMKMPWGIVLLSAEGNSSKPESNPSIHPTREFISTATGPETPLPTVDENYKESKKTVCAFTLPPSPDLRRIFVAASNRRWIVVNNNSFLVM